MPFVISTTNSYNNPDYEMNYIDIQNNTSWLNDGIDIVVESKMIDTNGKAINGFPENDNWQMELLIYDAELEPNRPFESHQVQNKINSTRV